MAFAVPAHAQTINEILVHGNHTTPDADVLAIAALSVGEPADAAPLEAAAARLRDSHRFAGAEVRRRFRSITDPSDVMVVVLVDELPAVDQDHLIPGPMRRFRAATLWMPVLTYVEGDGVTYGARLGFPNVLGPESRVSVPLTWGGERRAGVEIDRPAKAGHYELDVKLGAAIWRNQNSFYDADETRREIIGEIEHDVTSWLSAAANGRVGRVTFADEDAWHQQAGVELTVDTRRDPAFPRNAVHLAAGWDRIAFDSGAAGRATLDARGYLGVPPTSIVIALRGALMRADAPLPPSEQLLLGGPESLRGYKGGYGAGDGLALLSAEARLPLTSPLNVGRFGVKAFVDAGTTWAADTTLADQQWKRGMGGGVYFGVAAFGANVDVAWPEDGKPRVHVTAGVTF